MIRPILCLPLLSFVISWFATVVIRKTAPRFGFVDKPGGRKIHANPKPLGGGVAIFWAFALPLLGALGYVHVRASVLRSPSVQSSDPIAPYVFGAEARTPLAIGILAATFVLHLMGL